MKDELKCPSCGEDIKGFPALSRLDNRTHICSDCGTKEALDDYFAAQENKSNE